jgi:hypothetical protein
MSSETKKLLLIGATGYDRAKDGVRLDCVSWDKIASVHNVRDYDVLILNLLSIGTHSARNKVNWEKFNVLLDFHAASDILMNNGKIVVLGDPRFEIPDLNVAGRKSFTDWTGATFNWDNQPGDTVNFAQSGNYDEFKEYAKHLRKWDYSVGGCSLKKAVFEQRWDIDGLKRRGLFAALRVYSACSNRYEHPLAFCIRHEIGNDRRTQVSYGLIYFLPEISLDEDETIQIVLRDFCNAASELPEPEWVSGFSVPGQKPIDEKIKQLKETLKSQQADLEKALLDRKNARTCLKLLYEREFALEPVVRDILRQLGANVEEPIEKNKEDGWVTIQVGETAYEGVLEIKSAKSDQFSEDGRRQVLDWIERGKTIRHKNYKGIFIGNSAVTKPLKLLGDRPDAFSDSWKKAAALSNMCAMKSEELYLIYRLHKEGKVNLDDFWTALFTTNGIFNIKPLVPKETK